VFKDRHCFEPEACKTCHTGFDHEQWEMYSGAKHCVTSLINRDVDPENKERAPWCQTCHMPEGNHRVVSAWGFLAVRIPEDDAEWMGYRTTITSPISPHPSPLPSPAK
jgi:hydroxylamine dehydrogenase